jgi:hypothetical protein
VLLQKERFKKKSLKKILKKTSLNGALTLQCVSLTCGSSQVLLHKESKERLKIMKIDISSKDFAASLTWLTALSPLTARRRGGRMVSRSQEGAGGGERRGGAAG